MFVTCYPLFIQTVLLEQTILVWKIFPIFFHCLFLPSNSCFAIISSNFFIYFKNFISIENDLLSVELLYKTPAASFFFKRPAMSKTFSPISRGSLSFLLFRSLVFPCILLLYLRVLLLLLIYENRVCLWNNYFLNFFLLFDWDCNRILLSVFCVSYLLLFYQFVRFKPFPWSLANSFTF